MSIAGDYVTAVDTSGSTFYTLDGVTWTRNSNAPSFDVAGCVVVHPSGWHPRPTSIAGPAAKPAAESAAKPATEPAAKPATEPATKPATEPAAKPAAAE